MHELAKPVKEFLLRETKTKNSCGVLLSNGVDSNSLLAALLQNGSRPTVISFRIENYTSTDWTYARRTADLLGLPFVDIELTTDVELIAQDVKFCITELGLRKKADIECFVPVMKAIDAASELGVLDLFTGAGADSHFGLNRKCYVAAHIGDGQDNPKWLDDFRDAYFARTNPAQTVSGKEYGAPKNVNVLAPYVSHELVEIFRGKSWKSLNKPKQKMPTRDAFPEMNKWRVGSRHTNLQLGDSKIAENYTRLLDSRFNTGNYKSPVGIYNAMARGEV